MTSPEEPVMLPAAQARQVLDLLQIAGHVISALRARGLQRDLTLADLEQLTARFEAAQQDLAAAILAGQAP